MRNAATQAEVAAILHAEWFMNVNRDREAAPDPITLPTPFPRPGDKEPVTKEELATADAYLAAHSAFG